MENWRLIFREAKRIVGSATTIQDAVHQSVAVARRNPLVFDEADYWVEVANHNFQPAFDTISSWSAEAFSRLRCRERPWRLIILDLGDCPESFLPYLPGSQAGVSEAQLMKLFNQDFISGDDFGRCFPDEGETSLSEFFGNLEELADHTIWQLEDALLRWGGHDFHGDNGYFLWLVVGSLAFVQQATRVSHQTERLHIVAGFEEIFAHFATIKGST